MAHDTAKPASIKKTSLYNIHASLGAKLVEFAGFWMPVQYRGIIEEHRKVRSSVGVFDVSHMGEFEFHGKAAGEFLQRLTINDVSKLAAYQAQYSALCYPDGGIVDDVIVYRWPDHYLMVVNAANIEKDFAWLAQHATSDLGLIDRSDEYSLLAVQGRNAQATLQKITKLNLAEIKYYWFAFGEIAGVPAFISRTGYTGEDGFEVGLAPEHSEKVWGAIFEAGQEFGIEPIGLGARDTLRLEMKYCLYGNDIDQTTNPLEAGLGWITKLDKGDFIGREAMAKMKAAGIPRRLVGFEMEGKSIARHNYPILKDGAPIGRVTSGTFSPSLEKSIGMGYVASEHAAAGTELMIDIRGRAAKAKIVKTPFYQRTY
ncbi:MAG: glycine cleavage system aminomethyltransferase GcvT [candidate division KSB1 bacterium]|nr:glycine cleavage system aminomethyltransferase GcvT [candidate division KSB1 bacterium]MDZ7367121.1 glycine cleavage system aminomethyltransferase GcvT [candidate division KSB1 bacterium]MDZ7405099.1 glycine cleavage system aminomethyltransferase GcvT [candidate division KSB1 bacterium]